MLGLAGECLQILPGLSVSLFGCYITFFAFSTVWKAGFFFS